MTFSQNSNQLFRGKLSERKGDLSNKVIGQSQVWRQGDVEVRKEQKQHFRGIFAEKNGKNNGSVVAQGDNAGVLRNQSGGVFKICRNHQKAM